MTAATTTPSRPEMACWIDCLRISRYPVSSTAEPTAARSAVRRDVSTLTTMKIAVGMAVINAPDQPPMPVISCWRNVSRRSTPLSSAGCADVVSSAVMRPAATVRTTGCRSPCGPGARPPGRAPRRRGGRPHRPARPAGGAGPRPGWRAPAEPHQVDRVVAVEEFGLEGRHRLTGRVHDRAAPADDLCVGAGLEVAQRHAGSLLDLVAQLLGVEVRGARRQPAEQRQVLAHDTEGRPVAVIRRPAAPGRRAAPRRPAGAAVPARAPAAARCRAR